MQTPTGSSFISVSGLPLSEKSTLVTGELGIMKKSLGFGIKRAWGLIPADS